MDGFDASKENCMPILVLLLIHQPKSNGLKLVIIFGQSDFPKWKAELHAHTMTEAPASRPSK